MSDQRNLILAIVLSVGIILLFQVFYEMPRLRHQEELARQQAAEQAAADSVTPTPETSAAGPVTLPGSAEAAGQDRDALIEGRESIPIDNGRLHGSLSLKGARLDDITLADYHETINPDSPEIVLLSPAGSPNTFFAEFGWVAGQPDIAVPDGETVWQSPSAGISADEPGFMSWDNGNGLLF